MCVFPFTHKLSHSVTQLHTCNQILGIPNAALISFVYGIEMLFPSLLSYAYWFLQMKTITHIAHMYINVCNNWKYIHIYFCNVIYLYYFLPVSEYSIKRSESLFCIKVQETNHSLTIQRFSDK